MYNQKWGLIENEESSENELGRESEIL